jgi:hypothetical protein
VIFSGYIYCFCKPSEILSEVEKNQMPCPSMGPKWFWTNQIILVDYQLFWTGPIHFGQVQIILERSKLQKIVQESLICTWPKCFWSAQNGLDMTKTICTSPKQFGRSQIILDLKKDRAKIYWPGLNFCYSRSKIFFLLKCHLNMKYS